MTGVQTRVVGEDEADLRLDRWFGIHFPELNHGRLQKMLRKGQVRVDGRRAKAGLRLTAGAQVRVPPLGAPPAEKPRGQPEPTISKADADLIQSLVLYKDQDAIALNKPPGLAVQGGTGTHRHIDGMLDALRFDATETPRLVHRLDRDTSGVLLLGRTRAATAALGQTFRSRTTRKLYWAITVGVPEAQSGRIDLPLAKLPGPAGEKMVVDRAKGQSATTVYRVIERIGSRLALVALWPWTGRTHQLRVHCAAIGCPILGDGKYGGADAFVTGHPVSRKVHLHARSLTLPHPSRKGDLSVTAPLPDHMMETWSLFGLDPNDTEDPFADDVVS